MIKRNILAVLAAVALAASLALFSSTPARARFGGHGGGFGHGGFGHPGFSHGFAVHRGFGGYGWGGGYPYSYSGYSNCYQWWPSYGWVNVCGYGY